MEQIQQVFAVLLEDRKGLFLLSCVELFHKILNDCFIAVAISQVLNNLFPCIADLHDIVSFPLREPLNKSPHPSWRHIFHLILCKNLDIHKVCLRFLPFIRRKICSPIRALRFIQRFLYSQAAAPVSLRGVLTLILHSCSGMQKGHNCKTVPNEAD